MSVEHSGLTSHAASGGKNQWGKNSMFNISNAVTIFMLLCILMTFIGRFKAKGAVTILVDQVSLIRKLNYLEVTHWIATMHVFFKK